MTIWEIDKALEALVDPETGELRDFESFMQLQMERSEKIENTVLWLKNLRSDIAELKAAEDALKERRQVKERRAERLREYIENALCGEKFETARCSVGWRRSRALELGEGVVDWLAGNGHGELVIQQAPKIDRKGVTELLKSGVEVPGAVLVERNNMVIK